MTYGLALGFAFTFLLVAPTAWASGCDDGIDNDGDGLIDYPNDPGCADLSSVVENPPCDDNHDNDGDGLLDWDGAGVGDLDPECAGEPFGKSELVAGSAGCVSGDVDADGIIDCEDNCSTRANPTQLDVDGDLCGNLCDANYTQSGTVGFSDFGIFTSKFGSHEALYEHQDPADGTVGFDDWGFYSTTYGYPPGPSGTTPGTIACP